MKVLLEQIPLGDSRNNFTNAQLRHNRDQEIPQYGKVCVNYRDISGYYPKENFSLISKEPVFMGNKMCFLQSRKETMY